MRYLGIDYGSKRTGIAISDELKVIAQPLEFIPTQPQQVFLERLCTIVREKAVELIIVGMPRNMDGTYGQAAEEVNRFVAALRLVITVPIQVWDERLTSVQANRALLEANVRRNKRKEFVDKTAAALLLQSYLDSLSS